MVACGFGSGTGMAITLLVVVSTSFPPDSTPFGQTNPVILLSVYLLM